MLALLAFAGLPFPAAGAEPTGSLQDQAAEARARNGPLSGAARAAWLSVVSLDTRIEQTEAALLRLGARTEAIAQARADVEAELRVARRNLGFLERRLAARLRNLYEEGHTADPLAVVLGSSSMGEALEGLDSLNRVAAQDRQLLAAAQAARRTLDALTGALATREAEARRADEANAATAVSLAAVRSERKQAHAPGAGRRSRPHAAAAKAPAPAQPPARERTLTVTATGYALSGKTATGVSVAWGIVAVDPGVIALGTRMSIPGYGEGVAADTGSAIRGARIDLWFPTLAEARAWGSRTITITLL